ncbi:von Willebrand factor D and EGF domain-containing protein-like [Saccostrea cucullata]|uniref:von Willebrand factor D and EGF domain-containing protein-like n=2 Tax=Saccostrea cuccullata TaxID=36930 RepID=UPI002ED35A35
MVNNKTRFYECGTHYGIYMQGDPPTKENEVVTRTACVIPHCTTKYTIKVKKCNTFTAYYLPRPTSCDQAYCFGFGVNGIAPNKTTEKPSVEPKLVKVKGKTVDDESYQKLVFQCKFRPIRDDVNRVLYKVFWYINNHTSTIFASKAVPESSLSETFLEGKTGLNSIKLGVEISCKVRLYYDAQGPPGPSSEKSQHFFAGVQPLKRSYTIIRGDKKESHIEFKLTVPFGCTFFSPTDTDPLPCSLSVELTTPDYLKCSQGIYAVNMCGKTVSSLTWNQTQSIAIHHKDNNNYRTVKTFEVHLKTKVRENGGTFWDAVEVPTIYINVIEGSERWKGLTCVAVSDPHMTSFENKHYDSQNPGTYTLYRNMDEAGNVNEIQMKVTSCLLVKGHMNQCACAVAVRAASDIFVIDRCPKTSPRILGFQSCVEDILHVIKNTNDEHQYEIHFPSKTYMTVRFSTMGDADTLELNVYPSPADENRSEGLCGTVGIGALRTPAKEKSAVSIDTFTSSWLVPDEDNMLKMDIKQLQSFPRTKNSRDLCICKPTKKSVKGDIIDTLTCTNEDKELITCEKDNRKPVQKDICYERHSRRKRSIDRLFTYIPNNYVHPKRKRTKRAVTVAMTEPEARLWCENYLNNSPGFVACKSVPNMNTKQSVEICVLDILATNSTLFASAPRESLKTSCLKELDQNETLRNTSENGENLAEKIFSLACPNDCSDNGICRNGTCNCSEGFGAGDCSINLNDPPVVFAVNYETGGLCDKLFCKVAVVEGDQFLNRPELTCKMKRFEMNMNGTAWELETTLIPGDHNTIGDIRCKFPHSISKRSVSKTAFVTGYHVSVSNNKRNFSDVHPIYILDSTCQDTVNVSGQLRFALKAGFCFIHGSCLADGFQKGCYECDVLRNTFEWSFRGDVKGCKVEEEKSDSKLWIIAIFFAVSLLVAITLLFLYVKKKKQRVIHDNSMLAGPSSDIPKSVKYNTNYKY